MAASFLVDEGESVTGLVSAALRRSAREGRRMPLLGVGDANSFLYTTNRKSDALKANERISFNGCMSFMLWQKAAHHAAAYDTWSESVLVNSLSHPSVAQEAGQWDPRSLVDPMASSPSSQI